MSIELALPVEIVEHLLNIAQRNKGDIRIRLADIDALLHIQEVKVEMDSYRSCRSVVISGVISPLGYGETEVRVKKTKAKKLQAGVIRHIRL